MANLDTVASKQFSDALLNWFDHHGRKDLPWQKNISAYRVWVSEIMLQQTQVKTVIPYFEKFIARFPDVTSLASAKEDDVLHYWSGLGYYSRARNLHKSAKQICQLFNAELPNTVEALISLPGIGRSTAGAIAAIAFHQHNAILDGNVKRVLARYYAVDGWPGKSTVANTLWELAEALTPKQRVADYTQAIMDLGATLCSRSRPSCPECPRQRDCQAFQQDRVAHYPGKKPKKVIPIKTTAMYVVVNQQGHLLLQKRPATGVWASLWSLPEDPQQLSGLGLCHTATEQGAMTVALNQVKQWTNNGDIGATLRHTFSHFHLDISPRYYRVKTPSRIMEAKQWLWFNPAEPAKVGIAAPVKKLIDQLVK